jgi:hypothetical protein
MAQKLQNINTGKVIEVSDEQFKTGGQALSDVSGFVPVAPGTAMPGATAGVEALAGGTGGKTNFDRANELLSDIQTPMSIEDIRAREKEQIERTKETAASVFDPLERRAAELGEHRLGSAKGQVGISRGLGLSTAEGSSLRSIEKETQDRMMDIQKQRAEFISSGNFKAAELAQDSINKLQEAQNNILFKKIDLALQLGEEERAEKSMGFEERRVEIAEGAADLAYEQFGFEKESFGIASRTL